MGRGRPRSRAGGRHTLRFAEVLATSRAWAGCACIPEHRALAREAAAKSVVLLRNRPVDGRPLLPIGPRPGRVDRTDRGGSQTAVNLGDGGSSDVWAPEVVTVADGLARRPPGVRIRPSTTERSRSCGGSGCIQRTSRCVVVGYTNDDEGEFIGEAPWPHLAISFPGPDDPELVGGFAERIAERRLIEPPDHVAGEVPTAGFVTGGDRGSFRLHDRRRRAHPGGGGGEPAHDRRRGRRERSGDLRMGSHGAGDRAVVVLGDGRRSRVGRRAGRRSGCVGTASFLGSAAESRPPAFDA